MLIFQYILPFNGNKHYNKQALLYYIKIKQETKPVFLERT